MPSATPAWDATDQAGRTTGTIRPGTDAALARFRAQVGASRLADEQLDAVFEDLRDQVWRERAGGESGQRDPRT